MILIKGVASLGAAMLIGLSTPSAQAGYVVDLTQHGNDIVATGSGRIDLTGLTFKTDIGARPGLVPSTGFIVTGGQVLLALYVGITGPANFGTGDQTLPGSNGGDFVGVDGLGATGVPAVLVPAGYVSDSPLSDTSTYSGETFSSLGATPGTYKWTWGAGSNQNFTLVIGTAVGSTVPEPSTWAMMLLGFVGLSFI
jgi:hypothetical protein